MVTMIPAVTSSRHTSKVVQSGARVDVAQAIIHTRAWGALSQEQRRVLWRRRCNMYIESTPRS